MDQLKIEPIFNKKLLNSSYDFDNLYHFSSIIGILISQLVYLILLLLLRLIHNLTIFSLFYQNRFWIVFVRTMISQQNFRPGSLTSSYLIYQIPATYKFSSQDNFLNFSSQKDRFRLCKQIYRRNSNLLYVYAQLFAECSGTPFKRISLHGHVQRK